MRSIGTSHFLCKKILTFCKKVVKYVNKWQKVVKSGAKRVNNLQLFIYSF